MLLKVFNIKVMFTQKYKFAVAYKAGNTEESVLITQAL